MMNEQELKAENERLLRLIGKAYRAGQEEGYEDGAHNGQVWDTRRFPNYVSVLVEDEELTEEQAETVLGQYSKKIRISGKFQRGSNKSGGRTYPPFNA